MGITVFLYLDNFLVLANSDTQANEDGQSGTVTTETRFHDESEKVPAGTYSRIYTLGPGVQHAEYDFVASPG